MTRRRTLLAVPLLTALASGCDLPEGSPATLAPEPSTVPATVPARLLVVTATTGFQHDSIPTATDVLARLGQASRAFEVTVLPDVESLSRLTAETLAAHDAVFFASTSGELPLDAGQKQALLDFVAGGRGFLGAHSASDTLYSWPEYGQLVGAYFREHPWTQPAVIAVEDESHPLCAGLGATFTLEDEIYVFRSNPRPRVRVLLRLQAASVGAVGDFPLSWCARYGSGRTFYSALGHFDAVWQDASVQRHLLAAVRWATGRLDAPADPLP